VGYNFDHPSALDTPLLVAHLEALKAGPIEAPVYDFVRHRRKSETRHVEARPVILAEGILLLAEPEVRELLDFKIYVDTDADVRLARRISRDLRERGRRGADAGVRNHAHGGRGRDPGSQDRTLGPPETRSWHPESPSRRPRTRFWVPTSASRRPRTRFWVPTSAPRRRRPLMSGPIITPTPAVGVIESLESARRQRGGRCWVPASAPWPVVWSFWVAGSRPQAPTPGSRMPASWSSEGTSRLGTPRRCGGERPWPRPDAHQVTDRHGG